MTATVCVPSGIVKPANSNCPSVTGLFAADALAKQQNNNAWWGGQQLPGAESISARLSGIPSGITGWKLYLAQEYLRSYGGARPADPGAAGEPRPGAAATRACTRVRRRRCRRRRPHRHRRQRRSACRRVSSDAGASYPPFAGGGL